MASLLTLFSYQLIARPGNKTVTHPRPQNGPGPGGMALLLPCLVIN